MASDPIEPAPKAIDFLNSFIPTRVNTLYQRYLRFERDGTRDGKHLFKHDGKYNIITIIDDHFKATYKIRYRTNTLREHTFDYITIDLHKTGSWFDRTFRDAERYFVTETKLTTATKDVFDVIINEFNKENVTLLERVLRDYAKECPDAKLER